MFLTSSPRHPACPADGCTAATRLPKLLAVDQCLSGLNSVLLTQGRKEGSQAPVTAAEAVAMEMMS